MRWQRSVEGVLTYDDLLETPRHLAALGRYDELAGFADDAAAALPGVAVAEVLPGRAGPTHPGHLILVTDRAWVLVAEQEFQAVVAVGDLGAATERARTMRRSVVDRAAADPTNTEWQRDLSISPERLGDLARAAGDLTAPRTAHQAGLDIRARLAAADPSVDVERRKAATGKQGQLTLNNSEFCHRVMLRRRGPGGPQRSEDTRRLTERSGTPIIEEGNGPDPVRWTRGYAAC
jgi:hypothetical protein